MQLLHWLPRFLLRHKTIDLLCKIGLQNRVSEIEFNNGARTVIDLSDPEPRNVFIQRKFEPHFFDIAKILTPQKGVFFDLGANVGFCSFGLVSYKPGAHFHLFEANPRMINLLNQSIDVHQDYSFKLTQSCLSDREGHTPFHLTTTQSGQSHVATSGEEGISVLNLLLDKYCQDNGIVRIDFAKIDLEGHEVPALNGWRRSLAKHNAKALYIEIIPENQARYGYQTNAPLLFLESLGYRLFLCKPDDFGNFGSKDENYTFAEGTIALSEFRAQDYPPSFATDVLALAKK